MSDKQYRRLQKSLKARKKVTLKRAWRNLFVKSGYLKGE